MKKHLFYTFLAIFAFTAVVTLLGVMNVIAIKEGYLTALVTAFVIELAGAVIAIFKTANFFSPETQEISAEDEIRESIRKLDSAFGHLHDRLVEHNIHIHARMLVAQNAAPTPRTDMVVLMEMIRHDLGKVRPEVITEALGAIATVIEEGVRIGSHEQSTLITLCNSLPPEFSGISQRILNHLK